MNTLSIKRITNKNDLKIKNGIIISDYIPDDVIDLFNNFLKSGRASKQVATNNGFIRAFFFNRIPKNKNDFSDATFYEDARICNSKCDVKNTKDHLLNSHETALFKSFYSYLIENDIGDFEKLNLRIINYNSVIKLVNNGYMIVEYEPTQNLPACNKWILFDSKSIKKLDFNLLNSSYKKDMLKDYILNSIKPDISTKYDRFLYYVDFLNVLPEHTSLPVKINYSHIREYKDLCEKKGNSNGTIFVKMSSVKAMSMYFKTIKKSFQFSDFVLNAFRVDNMRNKGKTQYYDEQQMNTIILKLKEQRDKESNESNKRYYALTLIIVLYILNTAMRLESVLNLNINSLKEGMPGCYYYQVDGKRTYNEQYDIPSSLKPLHDEVLELTNNLRSRAPNNLQNKLFIYCRPRGKVIQVIRREAIGVVINKVCRENNIPELGVSGIRNRFMNNIITKLDAGSDLNLIAGLSKHSLSVHLNNYYNGEIEELCSSLYNVNIGATPFTAIITLNPNITDNTRNTVMNGCGVCSEESCLNNSEIDCILCKYFITCPTNIPFIEKEIEKLENEYVSCKTEHERESKIALKRVYVKLLSEIYKKINEGGQKNA